MSVRKHKDIHEDMTIEEAEAWIRAYRTRHPDVANTRDTHKPANPAMADALRRAGIISNKESKK